MLVSVVIEAIEAVKFNAQSQRAEAEYYKENFEKYQQLQVEASAWEHILIYLQQSEWFVEDTCEAKWTPAGACVQQFRAIVGLKPRSAN